MIYTPGARSAAVRTAPQCNLQPGLDLAGNDFASTHAKMAATCCDHCRQHSGRKAFTWTEYNGGTCWLKSAAVGALSEKSGAMWGTI